MHYNWGIESKNELSHIEEKIIFPTLYDYYSLLEYISATNSISQKSVARSVCS